MGKNNISEGDYNNSGSRTGMNKVGEELELESVSKKEKKYKQSENVTVISQVNRPKGFPVGREYLSFEPYEKKPIKRSIVESDDFQQQKNHFTVKEN